MRTHAPVMVREVMDILKPRADRRYLDGTLGAGGHAEKLLELSAPSGQLLALDWDEKAIANARQRLARFGDRLVMRRANFAAAGAILSELGWNKVDGALLDLGISSEQISDPEKGLSFSADQKLDMRMDARRPISAYHVVNRASARELEEIFRNYGEEPHARKLSLTIERARRTSPIETTGQLAALIERALGRARSRIHPATRVFQALRIYVNDELKNLEEFLAEGYKLLNPGARLVVISFHSLEDRLVKRAFARWSKDCLCPPHVAVCACGWKRQAIVLTSKPLVPSAEEKKNNPRSRSAKLRAVEKL
ncbi:MAG TPA: 16S rRNA (cytosine(1402)-N(4))-methyltransferase RsmH [Candidatus Acidoferrales bacterium]|nr:16S rRNA (cytosine(1402)-N(4))-methyltransferase RsmH [Candidatus Acidoferrales bacterium]